MRLAKVDRLSDRVNEAKLFGEESKFKIDIIKVILGFCKRCFMANLYYCGGRCNGLNRDF